MTTKPLAGACPCEISSYTVSRSETREELDTLLHQSSRIAIETVSSELVEYVSAISILLSRYSGRQVPVLGLLGQQ